jgi:enterochelin esterase-like enzyme
MTLTGWPLLAVVVGLALLLPLLTVLTWDKRRWRLLRRVTALFACELAVFAAAALAVNRSQYFYASWGDLLGTTGVGTPVSGADAAPHYALPTEQVWQHRPAPSSLLHFPQAVRGGPGAPDISAAAIGTAYHHQGNRGSLMLSVSLFGPFTGYRLPAAVYLPAAYFGDHSKRFPVLEMLGGYPASPQSWTHVLKLRSFLDQAIGNRTLPPAIAVVPTVDPNPPRDSECLNAVGGDQAGTYLGVDVPSAIERDFHAGLDRRGWSLTGYSAGGYCAVNLLLHYPAQFSAAVSLSGYFRPQLDAGTGDLFAGNRQARQYNDPTWEVTHRALLPSSLYLAASGGDPASIAAIHDFVPQLPPALHATVAWLPRGGHNGTVWRTFLPPALAWLGQRTH